MSGAALLAGVGVLAAATFALRMLGSGLRARLGFASRAQQVARVCATLLFCALIATSAGYDGRHFAGVARLIATAAAGVLAWRRAPFIAVVLAAVLAAAILRLAGIS